MPSIDQILPVSTVGQDPAEIVLRRRQLRRHFQAWCEYRMAKQERHLAKHHVLICQSIEQLLGDQLGKRGLILLMPPGSAKSTYTSVLLPAWFLNPEQHPNELMLGCSYSYTLIEGFGRQARDIVDQESKVLGVRISRTTSASGDWRTSQGGGYFCAGVNAGIAGHRASLGLIDDYIGSEEEADSQIIRDKNWTWYWNDFLPRLLPKSWKIIIANRRHEDDMVGRLLNDDGDSWHLVRLPMLAEDANDPLGRQTGERLWPEWFTDEQVKQAKKLPRTWAGLYQQRPAPEEGNFFRRENILTYRPSDLPADLRKYAGSDWALRKGQDNDRTCHLIGGTDTSGRLWIIPDWFWGRVDTLEATEEMFKLSRRHKPLCWWHGRENITGSVGPFIYRKMRDDLEFVPIEELPEGKDKQAKAQSIRAMMSAKMVMFPEFHPQWEQALHEMLTFPAGIHDDFVDALAKLGQGLANMHRADKPEPDPLDIAGYKFRPTLGWLKSSHNNTVREQKRLALDK